LGSGSTEKLAGEQEGEAAGKESDEVGAVKLPDLGAAAGALRLPSDLSALSLGEDGPRPDRDRSRSSTKASTDAGKLLTLSEAHQQASEKKVGKQARLTPPRSQSKAGAAAAEGQDPAGRVERDSKPQLDTKMGNTQGPTPQALIAPQSTQGAPAASPILLNQATSILMQAIQRALPEGLGGLEAQKIALSLSQHSAQLRLDGPNGSELVVDLRMRNRRAEVLIRGAATSQMPLVESELRAALATRQIELGQMKIELSAGVETQPPRGGDPQTTSFGAGGGSSRREGGSAPAAMPVRVGPAQGKADGQPQAEPGHELPPPLGRRKKHHVTA